jgi:two-component system NtrC family sensor kinase
LIQQDFIHKTDDNGVSPKPDEIMQMEKALMERPTLSIRFRIILAFLIAFLFSFAIGVASILYISNMEDKQNFFDHAAKFAFTVEQARRHEKNYFLYGTKTDLLDAMSNLSIAGSILQGTAGEMQSLLNQETFQKLKSDFTKYERLLNQIASQEEKNLGGGGLKNPEAEKLLRISGHRILTYAGDLMDQERIRVQETARMFMISAGFSLLINFIVMIWVASELSRQILKPLKRHVEYTKRIAAGDYRLIVPQKKFRDDFTDLAIAINRMIYELMEKQKQLVQSRKMAAVGTLTSGIAHELNNPLNNISITTEALIEGLDDYPRNEILDMLNDIFMQVERAGGTVRNLLDFTRLGKSKKESIEVGDLITSSLKLIDNERLISGVATKIEIESDLPRVKGNFRNLQQVFLNIFLNSIQAMPDGGTLEIHAKSEGDNFVKIDVTDNGIGIPKENLEKVFDPFFSTKEVGKGTGLGLSVSYGIIQNIGGRITVDSEQGKWTTFSVFLPCSEDMEWESQDAAMVP